MIKIQQTVASNVTQTYTSALFEKMGSLKTGMGTAAEGSQKLATGAGQLKEGGQTLTDHLTTLSNSSLSFFQMGHRLLALVSWPTPMELAN